MFKTTMMYDNNLDRIDDRRYQSERPHTFVYTTEGVTKRVASLRLRQLISVYNVWTEVRKCYSSICEL